MSSVFGSLNKPYLAPVGAAARPPAPAPAEPEPVAADVFADLPERPAPVPVDVSGHGTAVSAWTTDPDLPWCSDKAGLVWPGPGLWVARDVVEGPLPAGVHPWVMVRTIPGTVGAVHGQVTGGVSHVLVTDPSGVPLAQLSSQGESVATRGMLALAGLVMVRAVGERAGQVLATCASAGAVDQLGGQDWAAGWTVVADDLELPMRGLRELGVVPAAA